jgi:hypothetical protein
MGSEPIAELQSYNLRYKDSDLFQHQTAFAPESFRGAGLRAGCEPIRGGPWAAGRRDPHSFQVSLSVLLCYICE